LDQPPLARLLNRLERRQIAFPSLKRPSVSLTQFLRKLPEEDVLVSLSPYVVIRCIEPELKHEILAVNYINGRFFRLPGGDRRLIETLARDSMHAPVSKKGLRLRLERLLRFGVVTVSVGAVYDRAFLDH
jgi:hypothetical protein